MLSDYDEITIEFLKLSTSIHTYWELGNYLKDMKIHSKATETYNAHNIDVIPQLEHLMS